MDHSVRETTLREEESCGRKNGTPQITANALHAGGSTLKPKPNKTNAYVLSSSILLRAHNSPAVTNSGLRCRSHGITNTTHGTPIACTHTTTTTLQHHPALQACKGKELCPARNALQCAQSPTLGVGHPIHLETATRANAKHPNVA